HCSIRMRRDSTHGAAALTFRGVVRVALLSARPCKKIAIAERVTISHAVENDREILIPFAAPRAKTGHDELLMNSLKLLSYRAAPTWLSWFKAADSQFKPNELRSVSLLCISLLKLGDPYFRFRCAIAVSSPAEADLDYGKPVPAVCDALSE